jgi:hypothetical protein
MLLIDNDRTFAGIDLVFESDRRLVVANYDDDVYIANSLPKGGQFEHLRV